MRGNLSGADLETMVKTNDIESRTKVMADCRGTLSMAVAYRGLGLGLAVNPAKLAGKIRIMSSILIPIAIDMVSMSCIFHQRLFMVARK